MDNEINLDNFKQFFTSSTEQDDDFIRASGVCFSLSWKKDHWIVRLNNKKVGEIKQENLPKWLDIRDHEFILNALSALRKGHLDGLDKYIKGLKRNGKIN